MNRMALLGATALLLCAACTDDDGAGQEPIMLGDAANTDAGPTPDTGADSDTGADPDTGLEPDAEPDAEPDLGLPECGNEGDAEQPPPLNEHAAAYDPERRQMIIFGGNTAIPENCGFPAYTFLDTTWLYDVAAAETGCNPWRTHDGAGPRGRTRHAAVWADGAMWVYGGRWRPGMSGNYTVLGDLWRFDPATGWTEHTAPGPAPRFNTSLVYDSTRERLVLYGGNSNGGINPTLVDDVWAFDLARGAWSEIEVMGPAPSRRMWHAALYDPTRDQMVIHGGGDETAFFDDAQYFDGVWALDLGTATWSRLHAGGAQAPDGRFWGSLVYDDANDQYLMFAGHDDQALGNRNDLASFSPVEARWRSQSMGDRYNAPPNGFCDFPADFTVIEPGTPERRNAHSAVWAGDQMIVFGGKSDCGAVNDVWHYDDANGWTNPVMATEGEMCIRFRANPDNCVNMCF